MQLSVTFETFDGRPLDLPRQYNALLQGFVYRQLDRWLATRLHDRGLPDPQNVTRRLRLFTFSRLLPARLPGRPPGSFRAREGRIAFAGPVRLVVASPLATFLQSFAAHLLARGSARLGSTRVRVVDVSVAAAVPLDGPLAVEALSPVTVYRTIEREGRPFTRYYGPHEPEFAALVVGNLLRKLRTFQAAALALGEDAQEPDAEVEVEDAAAAVQPLRVGERDRRVLRYRETVIEGWTGRWRLDLPAPLLRMALDAGLGAKNSQGFGCVVPCAAPAREAAA